MHPILLKIGSFNIYSYGAMVALGFAIATRCIYIRAPKFNVDRDRVIDLAILILLFGIFGARALYVLLNIKYYLANPMEMPNLSKGGLVWYGGFILATLALFFYIKRKALDFWVVSDLMAPYVALAQGFGRIGCFLNGCCYGTLAPKWLGIAVKFPYESTPRIPTQILSALALFGIFSILRIWQDREHDSCGKIFLAYGLLYSLKRFLMEFLRGDNPKMILNLSLSQLISALIFIVCLIIFRYRMAQCRRKPSISK